ncbi:MAG TPA: pectin acetylesterase-family hydrolase [Enhygromyxa sp.]|nr:pectin acetylesterase-family hydrolase [Enhygromyxa sp.]
MRCKPWMMSTMLLAACASDPALVGTETDSSGTDSEGSSGPESGDESGDTGHDTSDSMHEESGEQGTEETPDPPEPFCGDGNVDPDEQCDDGNDNSFDGCRSDCTLVELLEPPPMEWTYVEVPGTRCMNGSPAGFGVNYNPDSSNVMIYLEGGGACFSDSCDFTAFSIPFIPPSDGIFSRSNNANPVKDWTMIYVPYCTGDIHAGDAEQMLGGQLRQFRGYSNITKYLEQWVPSFPAERVLLTGISAGGFGAALNSTQVADAYGDVELTVIDDSGPPLSSDVIPPCLQAIFRATWNLDATVLADCPTCDPDDFATGLLDNVLVNYPNIRFGLFSNTSDAIISTYMGAGWGNGQHDNCEGTPLPVPALTYAEDLFAIRALHEDEASSFYVLGLGHTALRVGFNITFADGTSLPEWIGDVLDGQITHVGP